MIHPALAELVERTLTAEELRSYVEAPMSADERAEIIGLIAWFTRRYPTVAERLASSRLACTRANARQGIAGR